MPDTIHLIIIIVLTLFSAGLLYICSYKMLQIYQMSSYRNKEFFAWLKKTKCEYLLRYFSLAFFIFVPTALFVACFGGYEYVQYLGYAFFALLCVAYFVITLRQVKVPVKFTARIKRFSTLMIVIYVLLSFPLFLLTSHIYLQYALIGVLPFFIPAIAVLCNTVLLPLENLINNRFKKKAIKKLDALPGLVRIGITGSYGKTTAKNILSSFLSAKYKVCATPKSYNTPMGLTKVINENLQKDDEIFIAEMGARYCGDIKELCGLIKPRVGILTAIGDMHLETFKSKENIIKTKYELIDSLPQEGFAVFCGDDEILLRLYESCGKSKLISVSEKSNIQCRYSDVVVGESGTTFELFLDGESQIIRTDLLGKHIPSLIALCALTAYKLGVSLSQIAEAAKEIPKVPHRLELIKKGNMTIIDDAYNSNPEGAKNALELLGNFDGTKIVITPGMIELGDMSKQAHNDFGMQIAANSEYAIIIGRNASEIKVGIAASGKMPQEKVFIVKTLDEAMAELGKISADKKIVLFENDLPDNY